MMSLLTTFVGAVLGGYAIGSLCLNHIPDPFQVIGGLLVLLFG